jgi:hypothetical protein
MLIYVRSSDPPVVRLCFCGMPSRILKKEKRKMTSPFLQGVRSITFCVLVAFVAMLAASSRLSAQTHVVSSAELRQEALDATRARATNLQKVSEFLALPNVDRALRSAHVDLNQVKSAVVTLSDQELAQLASRAEKAQLDFAAGTLSDRDLLIIVVGIAALILIIVAVR